MVPYADIYVYFNRDGRSFDSKNGTAKNFCEHTKTYTLRYMRSLHNVCSAYSTLKDFLIATGRP